MNTQLNIIITKRDKAIEKRDEIKKRLEGLGFELENPDSFMSSDHLTPAWQVRKMVDAQVRNESDKGLAISLWMRYISALGDVRCYRMQEAVCRNIAPASPFTANFSRAGDIVYPTIS